MTARRCPGRCGATIGPDDFACTACWSILAPATRDRLRVIMTRPRLSQDDAAVVTAAVHRIRRERV